MIDCGRHFEPVDVLKRTLDGMAAVKLNVFHWHLTEDQGFRMQSLVFPRLTALGSDGLFYTQQDARDIVAYARDRGIRVVPEFEMPGHSVAWLMAYPELASGSTPTSIRREFGVSEYAIDPTRDETYTFIDKFLTEMATIFPDAYVHIGGDESPAPDWKKNPRILAFKQQHNLKDNDALQAYFNTRVLKTIARLHKHMVGWDEVLTPGLPKDVVIQSWRGGDALTKGAKQGYEGVLSAPYYLDGMKPAGVHYLADPLPSTVDLTPDQRKLVLGGEVCMWGEHLSARTIDSRIWPRTAAIAERFWSPESVRDVDDMYRRLEPTSIELETLGLTHLESGDAGLRELAATENIDALRTIAHSLEPVSFGERYHAQRTNQLTALDRVVDSVRPDPPSRHWTELLTRPSSPTPPPTPKTAPPSTPFSPTSPKPSPKSPSRCKPPPAWPTSPPASPRFPPSPKPPTSPSPTSPRANTHPPAGRPASSRRSPKPKSPAPSSASPSSKPSPSSSPPSPTRASQLEASSSCPFVCHSRRESAVVLLYTSTNSFRMALRS